MNVAWKAVTPAPLSLLTEILLMTPHTHRALRRPLKVRTLQLLRIRSPAPHMHQIVFEGDELTCLITAAPTTTSNFFPQRKRSHRGAVGGR